MKKNINAIFSLILTLFPLFSFAQEEIVIDGAKFTHSLVNKWIVEYKKEKPNSRIAIKNEASNESDLHILVGQTSDKINSKIVYIGRYALIPVTNSNNSLLERVDKGLKKKDMVNLLFEKDIFEEIEEDSQKEKYPATIYSRDHKAPSSIVIAKHFDKAPERIKGKKIIGDELYLLNAIQKDKTGVAFNTLNYTFDLKSRQLKSNISILPLQLKSKQKEIFSSGNVDQLIALLEETDIESIPVENLGLLIPEKNRNNQDLLDFVNWVSSHGYVFNHEFGFLNPDRKDLLTNHQSLSYNPSSK